MSSTEDAALGCDILDNALDNSALSKINTG